MIVSTLDNGAVEVLYPSPTVLRAATSGGGLIQNGNVDAEIEKWKAAGLDTNIASRFIKALAFGGCTTAEILGLITDKDVKGVSPELVGEVPFDRYFRNAWRRRKNGGPIWIDLEEARRMQARYILDAKAIITKRYEADAMLGHNYAAMRYGMAKDFDPISFGRKINSVRSWQELKLVWPEELRDI